MQLEENTYLKTAWKTAASALRRVGVKTPLLDARLLLQNVLGISYEELLTSAKRELSEKEIEKFDELISRRAKREPVSKILGEKDFWKYKFKVTKDTLDPRPDSETLIYAVKANQKDSEKEIKILDLGTGSGCLLISLLKEFPNSTGLGVDISFDALNVARENAEKLEVIDRVDFIQSNWLDNIEGRYDIIISNPPYIKKEAIAYLPAEVRLFDPLIALEAGKDGLKIYRELIPNIEKHLTIHGHCYFEIGKWQDHLVADIIKENGYKINSTTKDLAGVPRIIEFSKPYLQVVK